MTDFNPQSVFERLEMLGYSKQPGDDTEIDFIIEKATRGILDFCNRETLLPEMNIYAIEIVCGLFLSEKKKGNNLTLNDKNANTVGVKSIAEGDTNVSYAVEQSNSVSQNTDQLIQELLDNKKMLYKYRKLAWN